MAFSLETSLGGSSYYNIGKRVVLFFSFGEKNTTVSFLKKQTLSLFKLSNVLICCQYSIL